MKPSPRSRSGSATLSAPCLRARGGPASPRAAASAGCSARSPSSSGEEAEPGHAEGAEAGWSLPSGMGRVSRGRAVEGPRVPASDLCPFPPVPQPGRGPRAGGEAVRWVRVWEPRAPGRGCGLTFSHEPRAQVGRVAPCGMRAFIVLGEGWAGPREIWGWRVSLTVSTSSLPCWMVEEFVVAEECTPCSNFQAVSIGFRPLFSHI